ncbi:class I SAM-dependent methyltransferase [Paractinoplanes maris]|uniref:class I SAM-dependent methyltransferase n=1 Tax=Paractinoplanes maris TaxID=1734446 RepID=UPI0020210ABC|nr:class I SAM-dependent methyltransferase [Actinoplanes maris]
MSYPDFVAMINQTNVMPGAFATLNAWATFSRIGTASSVLELACTTGFSSRELARLTGCRAVGFDLSADAVALAGYNHRLADPALRLTYQVANGMQYQPHEKFSHVVVGAALGFFPDPRRMARRVTDFLVDGGYVLASPFWSETPLPDHVRKIRREVFGISSEMETYKEALDLFRGLDVMYESRSGLVPETDAEIELYCTSTVDRACAQSGIDSAEVRQALFDRLVEVKNATNLLRQYQRYSVLALRYDARSYPNRYVELF